MGERKPVTCFCGREPEVIDDRTGFYVRCVNHEPFVVAFGPRATEEALERDCVSWPHMRIAAIEAWGALMLRLEALRPRAQLSLQNTALIRAATALRDHLAAWNAGGAVATAEESMAMFEDLDAALAPFDGRE